ncbi:Spo0E family sporulation regulatory protein-aspartic acid phosphatase [Neobacillus mesonae]|uniref:Spo0E family sporulation regulatory protein-aspartic acid phosphatase n=1 Tax=Neobacillus mesonae TaxID=1193713 RepID=UPI00203EB5EF|nr:Spo0E family sporulation regulatory protein-aspartic acid phosphatase [Neobacillus mesonae]MCM3568077.1 Spo0E family sporulation regulatory protein-aspartic acid phosphatase [Neobacillus mesonae]
MILKEVVELRQSIVHDRLNMIKLAMDKEFFHPEVLQICQKIDMKIAMVQKIMYLINKNQNN